MGVQREEEPIARHLPLRASPGNFERWIEVDDEAELAAAVRTSRAEKLGVRVVSPFSDLLPPEGGLGGVALRLGRGFEHIVVEAAGLVCGASVPLAQIGLQKGFASLQNAGGTVSDGLVEGWLRPWATKFRRFRGRGFDEVDSLDDDAKSIVVQVWLTPSGKLAPIVAGTAFAETGRRGMDLRWVLAKSGVESVRLRDAALAEDDPAVIVNRGGASPKELRLLLTAVADKVKTATGLELTERLVPPGRGGRL